MKIINYDYKHKTCSKCQYIRESLWRVLNFFRNKNPNEAVVIKMNPLNEEQLAELKSIHEQFNIPVTINEDTVIYGAKN